MCYQNKPKRQRERYQKHRLPQVKPQVTEVFQDVPSKITDSPDAGSPFCNLKIPQITPSHPTTKASKSQEVLAFKIF